MRYSYEPDRTKIAIHGKTYICNHPVYNKCTLYLIDGIGLAVIQQKRVNKKTYWTEIDKWLVEDIYEHEGFAEYFINRASKPIKGLYPTVTIRQIMWALKMKPLKKDIWETTFDRCPI